VSIADEVKDATGTQEFNDESSTQRSSPETDTEAIHQARALNNLHFILCISPVILAQICSQ